MGGQNAVQMTTHSRTLLSVPNSASTKGACCGAAEYWSTNAQEDGHGGAAWNAPRHCENEGFGSQLRMVAGHGQGFGSQGTQLSRLSGAPEGFSQGTNASMGVSAATLEKTACRLCRTGAWQNDSGCGGCTFKVDWSCDHQQYNFSGYDWKAPNDLHNTWTARNCHQREWVLFHWRGIPDIFATEWGTASYVSPISPLFHWSCWEGRANGKTGAEEA